MKFETSMRICARWCLLCLVLSITFFITTNAFISRLYFLILSICSVLTAFKLEQVANAIKRERLCNFPIKHIKPNEHKKGEK